MATTDSERFCRVVSLLVDGGTMVLRRLLLKYVQAETALRNKTVYNFFLFNQGIIFNLQNKRILIQSQMDLIFPSGSASVDLDKFDITLLSVLLKSICQLTQQEEDQVEAMRQQRNQIYGHIAQAALTDALYKTLWKDISSIIISIAGHINDQQLVKDMQDFVLNLETCPLDMGSTLETIKRWVENDRELDRQLQEIKDMVVQMKQEQSATNQNVHNLENRQAELQEFTETNVKSLQSGIQNIQQEILTLSTTLKTARLQTDTLTSDVFKQSNAKETENDSADAALSCPPSQTFHERQKDRSSYTPLQRKTFAFLKDKLGAGYIETTIFHEAKTCLLEKDCVVLSGRPGEGKTLLGCALLETVSGDGRSLAVKSVEEWYQVDPGTVDAIFIDDIFGIYQVDEGRLAGWLPALDVIQSLVKDGHMKVIITTRSNILIECTKKLRQNEMFKNVVELASDRLSKSEKEAILCHILEGNGLYLSERDIHNCILNFTSPIGFPVCCKLFCCDANLFEKTETFFRRPLQWFMENLETLEKKDLVALIYLFYKGGEATYSELTDKNKKHKVSELLGEIVHSLDMKPDVPSVSQVMHSLDRYNKTYVIKSGQDYRFIHSIVPETIGLVYGRDNPEAVLQLCSSDFIHQCIISLDMEEVEQEDEQDYQNKVFIPEHCYPVLANRLIKEVCERCEVVRTANHSALLHPSFVQCFIDIVSRDENAYRFFHTKTYSQLRYFFSNFVIRKSESAIETQIKLLNLIGICHHQDGSSQNCQNCELIQNTLEGSCSCGNTDFAHHLVINGVPPTAKAILSVLHHNEYRLADVMVDKYKIVGNVDTEDVDICAVLQLAYEEKLTHIIDVLLQAGVVTPQCVLSSVSAEDTQLLRKTVTHLKDLGRWNVKDKYVCEALITAYFAQREEETKYLHAEGVTLLPCAVLEAIEGDHLEVVNVLIQRLKAEENWDPTRPELHMAMELLYTNGEAEVINQLLEEGALVTARCVVSAVEMEDIGLLRRTIENLKTSGIWTTFFALEWINVALIAAMEKNDIESIHVLLSEGACVTFGSLQYAVVTGNVSILQGFLEILRPKEDDPDNTMFLYEQLMRDALTAAFELDDDVMIHLLLDEGANVSPECLKHAVKSEDLDRVKLLVQLLKEEGKWDPEDIFICSALSKAFKYKRRESICHFLLQSKVQVTSKCLKSAVKSENVLLVKLAIDALKENNNWNSDDTELINLVLDTNDQTIVDIFLSEGAENMCLSLAVVRCDFDLVECIILKMITLNKWNPEHESVRASMMTACANNADEIVSLFSSHGVATFDNGS